MKTYNNIDMKGRLYDFKIDEISNEKGTALAGEITLEVASDGTLASLRFYAYPTYASGKKNKTYDLLFDMMSGNYNTVVDNGDEASWIAATGSIDVSYFLGRDSQDELARSQKIRGGFLNANSEKKYSNRWKLDFLITNIKDVDADEERGLPRYLSVSGLYIDGYQDRVNEVVFQARKDAAINYIAELPASADNPYFVSTWGQLTKTSRSVTRKNAFGEDEVDEYSSIAWTIEGMNPEPYEFDDDSVVGATKFAELKANLEAHKEEQLNKQKEANSAVTPF